MIIAIAMKISDRTALKKSYLLYVRFTYSKGTRFHIFNLKEYRVSDCFNSAGTKSHIFGPKNDNDSVQ